MESQLNQLLPIFNEGGALAGLTAPIAPQGIDFKAVFASEVAPPQQENLPAQPPTVAPNLNPSPAFNPATSPLLPLLAANNTAKFAASSGQRLPVTVQTLLPQHGTGVAEKAQLLSAKPEAAPTDVRELIQGERLAQLLKGSVSSESPELLPQPNTEAQTTAKQAVLPQLVNDDELLLPGLKNKNPLPNQQATQLDTQQTSSAKVPLLVNTAEFKEQLFGNQSNFQGEAKLDAQQLITAVQQSSATQFNTVPSSTAEPSLLAVTNSSTAPPSLASAEPSSYQSTGVDRLMSLDMTQENIERPLARQMTLLINNNQQQARLLLNPPELGVVDVTLEVQDRDLKLSLVTQTAMAREALDVAMPKLREILEENGINVLDAGVSQRDASSADAESQQEHHEFKAAESALTHPAEGLAADGLSSTTAASDTEYMLDIYV